MTLYPTQRDKKNYICSSWASDPSLSSQIGYHKAQMMDKVRLHKLDSKAILMLRNGCPFYSWEKGRGGDGILRQQVNEWTN